MIPYETNLYVKQLALFYLLLYIEIAYVKVTM